MMRCISAAGPSPSTCWLRAQSSRTDAALRVCPSCTVTRYVCAEEEVDVVRRERGFRLLVVDAVQDQVEIAVVALDLRMVHLGDGVFHASGWKWKTSDSIVSSSGVGPARSTQTFAPLAGSSQAGSTRSTVSVRPFWFTKMEIMLVWAARVMRSQATRES